MHSDSKNDEVHDNLQVPLEFKNSILHHHYKILQNLHRQIIFNTLLKMKIIL